MRSVLVITRHTPLPWEDGAGAYLHGLSQFLARAGLRVDVLWLAPHEHLRWGKIWRLPPAFDSRVRLRLPGAIRCGRWFLFPGVIWGPFQARALHRVRQLFQWTGLTIPRRRPAEAASGTHTAAPRPWMSPPSPAEMAVVAKFAARLRPDVVLASYAWMCPVFDLPALRGVRRACLAHDVAWKRAATEAARKGAGAGPEIDRAREAVWLRRADTIVAISAADAAELRLLSPASRLLVAPMAFATHHPHPSPDSHRLLFVGSGNAFNAEGLEWFLREVWPQLRQTDPAVQLDVCGSLQQVVSLRPAGVNFLGFVADLGALYRHAAVVIVPLLRATGMNIKLAEAASFGCAIVATPVVLEGAAFLRHAVITAETAADFHQAVRRLIADPAARLATAEKCSAAARDHLSPAASYGPLAAAFAHPAI